MTVKEAYAVHRTACRNVGKGKGYTHRNPERLEAALQVLHEFWAVHSSAYVTAEAVEKWDRERR